MARHRGRRVPRRVPPLSAQTPRAIRPADPAGPSGPSSPSGPPPTIRQPSRRRRRRPNRRTRLIRTGIIALAVVLVLVGGTYGYVRYRLGQIKTEPCASCAALLSGQPFNILIIGDDSRADNTPGENSHFGSTAQAGGAHSDTIKIAHIDPVAGTASLLSIPRDTYVHLSGLSTTWINAFGTSDQKINAALNDNVDSLVQTIQNSFGIPIQSWVLINFNGLIQAVQTVGGIKLDFPYPVRDDDNGNNNSGLSVPTAGCQTINGNETLALSRSCFYQYEIRPGVWEADGTGDLGRIQRQNVVIQALLDKAKSTYNPLTLNAFIGSVVNDLQIGGLSSSQLLSLAIKYHGFSGANLQTATVPTFGAGSAAGSVEIVQEPRAQQVITTFLGTAPRSVLTPPLDADGSPINVPSAPTGTTASAFDPASGSAPGSATLAAVTVSAPAPIPSYDPRPC